MTIAHRFQAHPDDADAYVEAALSFMLDMPDVNEDGDGTGNASNGTSPTKSGSTGGSSKPRADDLVSLVSAAPSELSYQSLSEASIAARPRTRSFLKQGSRQKRRLFSRKIDVVRLRRDGYLDKNLAALATNLQHDSTVDMVVSAIFAEIMCVLRDIVLGKLATPLGTVREGAQRIYETC